MFQQRASGSRSLARWQLCRSGGLKLSRWAHHATRVTQKPHRKLAACMYLCGTVQTIIPIIIKVLRIHASGNAEPTETLRLPTWDPRHNLDCYLDHGGRHASRVRINGMRTNGIQPHRRSGCGCQPGPHQRWDLLPHIMQAISNCPPLRFCSCKTVLSTGSGRCAISTEHDSSARNSTT